VIFVVLLLILFALGAVGYGIGEPKGRAWLGFWLGVLAGPLGWIIAMFLAKTIEVEAVDAQRRTAIETATGTAPQGTAPDSDALHQNLALLDLLERLHGLMQSGALTSDEYETQKRRLLTEQPTSPPLRPVRASLSRGWHPDPQHSGKERYYNGRKWTFQTRYKIRTQ
jgi:hypothetical protein